MRQITASLSTAFLLLVAGCANTVGLEPTTSYSGFDNANVVTIRPHGNACAEMVCTGLGAQWSAKTPETALLMVTITNEYRGIMSAQLNIDGQVVTLKKTMTATAMDAAGGIRQSTQTFVVPMSLVKGITSSKRTWLRVQTTEGSYENAVIDGEQDSKAFHALKRFLASVEQASAKS
ncbi:hypothetical protein [Comamonas testosteroni]|uniref:hypothetical protein n=1 Tax=Comamonas testosteroni TaxID=285 RepID=UPI0028F1210E|nr:hypothetical protein [Comamonas testosteroni]